MSPSEFDLRSVLRDGEGDVPDVEQVLAGARRRAQRRVRALSAAAVVVVVAGVATGVALFTHSGNASNDAQYAGPEIHSSSTAGPSAPSTSAGTGPRPYQTLDARCPASFPRTLLPGGGSPGQFGASGPLFASSVSSVVVCSYGAAGTNHDVVLRGAAADSVVRSLETASKRAVPIACPDLVAEDRTSLAIIGITPSGKALRAVTTTLPCDGLVTNGTAVRYNWTPPVVLLPTLRPLPTTGSASIIAPPPSATGSPIPRPVHGSPAPIHGSPVH